MIYLGHIIIWNLTVLEVVAKDKDGQSKEEHASNENDKGRFAHNMPLQVL